VSESELIESIENLYAKGRADRIALGKLLVEAKDQVGHGNFMKWVKANLSFTHRSATTYMIEYEESIELESASNLKARKPRKQKGPRTNAATPEAERVVLKLNEEDEAKFGELVSDLMELLSLGSTKEAVLYALNQAVQIEREGLVV
jgi:hypothetical protein